MNVEQKNDPLHIVASGLADFFQDDPKKIIYWLFCKNLNFGNSSPAELIIRGEDDKVAKFILAAQEIGLGKYKVTLKAGET